LPRNLLFKWRIRGGSEERLGVWYSIYRERAMSITSPFFVVPVIIVVFVVSILFATSSKEDGSSSH
jgi:hypothetical protein